MFIAFEGTDASGKATQKDLLAQKLESSGLQVERLSYPMYDKPGSALVRSYLSGEFGKNPEEVNPYLASSFYACDRATSLPLWIDKIYEPNTVVVTDRFFGSNAVHQAAKFSTREQKKDLFRWLLDYEINKLGLPMPDITFFLSVPIETSWKIMHARTSQKSGAANDIHEENKTFMSNSYDTGMMAAKFYGWTIIDCVRNGIMRSEQDIAQEIYQLVKVNLKKGA